MSEVKTEKIVGGRYRTPDGRFVDCNGYDLDGHDKQKEVAEKIAALQSELDQLSAQHTKPIPVVAESDSFYVPPIARLEAGSLSSTVEDQKAHVPDMSDQGKVLQAP